VEHLLNQVNGLLGNNKSSLRIGSATSSRGGISFDTNAVPSEHDISLIQDLLQKAVLSTEPETEVRVEIPSSKSSLKICDFPYFGAVHKVDKGKLLPVSIEEITKVIQSTRWASAIDFYENSTPRLSRNSKASDTGMVWFDIVDSRAGLQLKGLVGKSFMYGGRKLTFAPVDKHTGVPQCTRCWRFGHVSNARVCPLKGLTCPICGGPQTENLHRALLQR
jgi:hypothetical protein